MPNPAAPGGAESAAAGSGAVAVLPGTDNEVDVATTAALQASGGALLIDVREPSEYAEGHIPGITLIPMGEVQDRLAELPRDQPVILTCRSGNRSATVAEFLRGQGYDQVYSMQGGILAWEGAGQPVER
ncbi:MAG: rhodanese-like domain-containing protein [Chloroflexi bacterium]|nr:rhodanese-like domain-containing protein [Chloroflexota bacterium]